MAHLIDPGLWLWLSLAAWTLIAWHRKKRAEASRAAAMFGLFWLIGGSSIPERLLASLEREYPTVNIGRLEEADAVIVLGGGYSPSTFEPAGVWFPEGSAARAITGIELIRKQKAPILVMSGRTRYRDQLAPAKDADAMKNLIQEMRIYDAELITVGDCENTHDEAVEVGRIGVVRQWKRIILVTSAAHMHRAERVFRRSAGFDIDSVAVDYRGRFSSSIRIKPDLGRGLSCLRGYLYELAGRWHYRMKGWQ
jgi:uncharacterized SAM-binding protein YcdF (DUF218 family)